MEGYCSTGQSPQWAVVPVEEEEENIIVIAKKGVNFVGLHCNNYLPT
jgi:hypothetical protein